ncbi:hypothetical protein ACWAUP_001696 [Pseudomonas aeruginosa]|uniref:hypothetical protein n=1 Tax=Pseudomonas TaxID=286 RepID=UPI001E62511A|nr:MULTISPECIES: hypothetical protein [Pseudomonas]MDM3892779.1 hypothetical protein [Pseudomonas juntendi]WBM33159.1 hypothetical protein M2J80_01440 [Pseudomonas sp. NY11382]
MILLSDNDLIVKLAQCDLIGDTLAAFESKNKDCFVLNTMSYSLRLRDPDLSIRQYVGSVQAYERIGQFLEGCSTLDEGPMDFDLIEHIQQVDQIDPGEQALLLHAYDHHRNDVDYHLLTGDKRALRAICSYENLDAFEYLRTKVVCLETCMMDLIDYAGHEYINDRVSNARREVAEDQYDKVLRAAFGPGRNQSHSTECLRNYCNDIWWLLSY